jgi:hypothetical protein
MSFGKADAQPGSGVGDGTVYLSLSASLRLEDPAEKSAHLMGISRGCSCEVGSLKPAPLLGRIQRIQCESELPHYRSLCMLTTLCICTRAVVGEAEVAYCFDTCRSSLIEVALLVAA